MIIMLNYNTIINDYNYYALQVTRGKLFTVQAKVRTKQCQFNMTCQQVATQHDELGRQIKILAKNCDNFCDVVPLRMYPQCSDTEDIIITYRDGKSPVGRAQQFTKALYHFIANTNPSQGNTRMI